MKQARPGMFVPALIGGAFAGILTAIPFVNCLCCLWIIGGGMIAAYFLTKDSPVVLTVGDGAIAGVFAGIVGAVIDFLISIPLTPINNAFFQSMIERFSEYMSEMPEGWETWFEGDFEASLPFTLLGLVINVVVFSILGALGGIIGMSLLGRRTAPPAQTQGVIDVPKDEVTTETPDNHQS
jgi:hypothetical protein